MVSYVISGPDLDKLEKFGKQVLAEMGKVPGVVDLDSSLLDPVNETSVRPDLDRAAMLGVDPADITNTLAVLVGGVEASQFEDKGDQYVVWLRAAQQFRDIQRGGDPPSARSAGCGVVCGGEASQRSQASAASSCAACTRCSGSAGLIRGRRRKRRVRVWTAVDAWPEARRSGSAEARCR